MDKTANGSLDDVSQIFCFELCKHNKSNLCPHISKTKCLIYVLREKNLHFEFAQ